MKEATVRKHLFSLGIELYHPGDGRKWATRPLGGGKPIHDFDSLDSLWYYWRARCMERLNDQYRVLHESLAHHTAEPLGKDMTTKFKLPRRWLWETTKLAQRYGPISNEWLEEMRTEAAKDRRLGTCDTTVDLHERESSSARSNNPRLDHR